MKKKLKKKYNNKIIKTIRRYPGLSSLELEDPIFRSLRAKQLLRIRRISNWSETTEEMLRVTVIEEIEIENAFQSVGDDFKNALQQVLKDCHEETKRKIARKITENLVAGYSR